MSEHPCMFFNGIDEMGARPAKANAIFDSHDEEMARSIFEHDPICWCNHSWIPHGCVHAFTLEEFCGIQTGFEHLANTNQTHGSRALTHLSSTESLAHLFGRNVSSWGLWEPDRRWPLKAQCGLEHGANFFGRRRSKDRNARDGEAEGQVQNTVV